jgi:hypothetical protein
LALEIVAIKRLLGVQQGDWAIQSCHIAQQAQHRATAATLASNDVPSASRQRLQLVIDRSAFDPGDQHFYCSS